MAHSLNPYPILASAFLFSVGFAFDSPAHSSVIAEIASPQELLLRSPFFAGTLPVGVATSPDGRYVYITNNGASTLSIIDAVSHALCLRPWFWPR